MIMLCCIYRIKVGLHEKGPGMDRYLQGLPVCFTTEDTAKVFFLLSVKGKTSLTGRSWTQALGYLVAKWS